MLDNLTLIMLINVKSTNQSNSLINLFGISQKYLGNCFANLVKLGCHDIEIYKGNGSDSMLSSLVGCYSSVFIRRIIYTFLM